MKQKLDDNEVLITCTNANDLNRYQKSILAVLSRIKIENFDDEFKNDLKTIYELLSHLERPRKHVH